MPSEPRWLPLKAVVEINHAHVEGTGENHALLSKPKLEGALVRPQNLFHYRSVYSVVTLGVSLMFAIAEAHAFEQGNKRTGFTSGLAFLHENGFIYDGPDTVDLATSFKKVIERKASQMWFQSQFIEHVFEI